MELTLRGMQGLKPTTTTTKSADQITSVCYQRNNSNYRKEHYKSINQQSLLDFLAQMPGGIARSLNITNGFELGLIYFFKNMFNTEVLSVTSPLLKY